MTHKHSRRVFIKTSVAAGIGMAFLNNATAMAASAGKMKSKLGLVTYLWGKDWDVPTLISNCIKTGYQGVELRVGHAHKVETNLSSVQRAEVKKRFADSPVTLIGYGSNYEFHSPDKLELRKNIDGAKEYVKLCSDIGATGLKVKPNNLPDGVPREKTIAQIAASLNELGRFASDYGQLIRVEAHGRLTQELPNMKAIFDRVTEKNVKICWNCNNVDNNAPGIAYNFNLVKQWIGDTTHIREMNKSSYPYAEMYKLFAGIKYRGWFLLEAQGGSIPEDRIAAMILQREIYEQLISEV